MLIRQTSDADIQEIMSVQTAAFGSDEEATLTAELLADPSAAPCVSLLAYKKNTAVGHILFTKAQLDTNIALTVYILAPLAVTPKAQGEGVGGMLIEHGLDLLKHMGVGLAFVLGHPGYYPRFGFTPAGTHGFQAPFPIEQKHLDAWMVKGLLTRPDGRAKGKIMCAQKLNKAHYWSE